MASKLSSITGQDGDFESYLNGEGLLALISTDESIIRATILLEILSRAKKDIGLLNSKLFSESPEYKIIMCLLMNGPMNKSKMCLILSPSSKDSHYMLSRKGSYQGAFIGLVKNGIIVPMSKKGKNEIFGINPVHLNLLRLLLCS